MAFKRRRAPAFLLRYNTRDNAVVLRFEVLRHREPRAASCNGHPKPYCPPAHATLTIRRIPVSKDNVFALVNSGACPRGLSLLS
jgi:hypothetical protein